MKKYYKGIPRWLDPATEVRQNLTENNNSAKKTNSEMALEFLFNCFNSLYNLEYKLSDKQVIELSSFYLLTTNGGKNKKNFNLTKWQITENYVYNYKTTHGGKSPKWYEFNGKYYKAFNSYGEFFKEWIATYLPMPKTTYAGSVYVQAGDSFWNNLNWYSDYLRATSQPIEKEFIFLNSLTRVKILLAQYVLNLPVNGFWDDTCTKTCKEYQEARKLEITGKLNNETFKMILDKWKNKNIK